MTTLPVPVLYIVLPIAGMVCGALLALLVRRRNDPAPLTGTGDGGSGWGKWAMDNGDKFLLSAMMILLLALTIHVLHDGRDDAQIQFFNGLTNTFSGALITLVTGSVLRKTTGSTVAKDDAGKTVSTVTVKDEQ